MNTIRRIKPIRESRRVEGNTVKVSTLMKGLLIFTLACLASAAAIYGNTITGVTDVNSTNLIYSPTYCNATVCKELSAWDTNTGVIPADFFNNITDAQAALAGNNTVRDSNDSALAGRLDTMEGWGDWTTPMGEATDNITLINASIPKWDNMIASVLFDVGGGLDYNSNATTGEAIVRLRTDCTENQILKNMSGGWGCAADTAAGVGIAVELTNTGAGGRIDTNESFGIGFNVSNGSLIVGEGLFMFLGNESRIHHTTNNTIKIDENLNVTGNITTQELADCNAIGGDANGMLTCGSLSVVQNFTCRYPTIDYNMPSAAWDNATNYYIVAPATARYRILASGVVRATSVDTGGAGTGFKLQLADNGVPYAYTLRSGWTKSEYWSPFNLEWTADITTGHNITLQAQYFFTGGYELLANSTHSKPYICLIRLTT